MIHFKTVTIAFLLASTGLLVSSCDFKGPLGAEESPMTESQSGALMEPTGGATLGKEISCGETETAWAFGGYTFIDEGIAVRWGWFEDLTVSDLPFETEIWAAAGRNDTTKGTPGWYTDSHRYGR